MLAAVSFASNQLNTAFCKSLHLSGRLNIPPFLFGSKCLDLNVKIPKRKIKTSSRWLRRADALFSPSGFDAKRYRINEANNSEQICTWRVNRAFLPPNNETDQFRNLDLAANIEKESLRLISPTMPRPSPRPKGTLWPRGKTRADNINDLRVTCVFFAPD